MTTEPDSTLEIQEMATCPTYAPAAMSMSVMMLAWGILTHWSVSLIGAGLFAWALWSWISEICLEWGIRDES